MTKYRVGLVVRELYFVDVETDNPADEAGELAWGKYEEDPTPTTEADGYDVHSIKQIEN